MKQENAPFSGKAEVYAKGRPEYPMTAISFLSRNGFQSGKKIADIGAGTGLFSKALLKTGAEVFAIEPDDDMRAKAFHDLSCFPLFHAIDGSAEKIPLPDQSVDFITAAQAFHWFDKSVFKRECLRVLKPHGRVALIWNVEIFGSDFFKDYGIILKKHTHSKDQSEEEAAYLTENYFFKPAEIFLDSFQRLEFENNLFLNLDTFICQATSSSASPKKGDPEYIPFVAELKTLFERYQKNNTLFYPYKTVLYFGTVETK